MGVVAVHLQVSIYIRRSPRPWTAVAGPSYFPWNRYGTNYTERSERSERSHCRTLLTLASRSCDQYGGHTLGPCNDSSAIFSFTYLFNA